MNRRVLVVDDEPTVRSMVDEILTAQGLEVVQAANADQAFEAYTRSPFEVVVADVHIGERSGIDLIEQILRFDREATVVVLTGDPSTKTATRALESGAYDYLVKPFASPQVIRAAVDRAMERVQLFDRNRILLEHLERNSELLESVNAKLTDIANRDPLTGLFNHRFLVETLGLELCRARRHDRQCALIIADVDDFQRYTEAQGSVAGDDLLRTIARLLQAQCRSSTLTARFGGDEFALLVPEVPPAGALTFAEKLGRAVEHHAFPGSDGQPEGRVTLSFGVAVYPEAGQTVARLVASATAAIEAAKQSGRNSVSIWQGGSG